MMMTNKIRLYLYTCGLILSGMIFSGAESCSTAEDNRQRQREEELRLRMSVMESVISSEEISESMRIAFERKACEKVEDFADYFTTSHDKSLSAPFRATSRQLMRQLTYNSRDTAVSAVPGFADSLEGYEAINFQVDSVRVAERLSPVDQGLWRGMLEYRSHIVGSTNGSEVVIHDGEERIDFFVVKVDKRIGNDTHNIWQVFIGDD